MARSSTLRLSSGRSTICSSVTVRPTEPLSVLRAGASAVTVMVSCVLPGLSVMFTVVVVAVSTLTFSTVAALKPFISTLIE